MKSIIISIILLFASTRILYSLDYKSNIFYSKYTEALIEAFTQDEILLAQKSPKDCIVIVIMKETDTHFEVELLYTEKWALSFESIRDLPILGISIKNKWPVYFFESNLSFIIDSLYPIDQSLKNQILDLKFNCDAEDCVFNFAWKVCLFKNYEFDKYISYRHSVFKDVSILEDITTQYLEKDTAVQVFIDPFKALPFCEKSPKFKGDVDLLYDIIKEKIKGKLACFDKDMRARVGFTVGKDGSIGQFRISSSSDCAEYDSIAIDIVKQLPLDYFPGEYRGEKVNCHSSLWISNSK